MSVGVLWTLVMAMVATVVTARSAPEISKQYCNITCNHFKHTMCHFPNDGPAASCGLLSDTKEASHVSEKDIAEILEAHNKIRSGVAEGKFTKDGLPAARSMPPLAWDEELAAVAQRWAFQCVQDHDKCRNVPRWYVGQNAAFTWISDKSMAANWTGDAVNPWFFGELPDFQQGSLKFVGGTDHVSLKPIGHLTQVIWAKSTLVGCGYAKTDDNGWALHSYFCNYGPAGNYIDENMYEAKED